ncbi:MAG: amidohydrolase family protein [Candidatus Dormibacteraceae bacterium]
MLIDVHSRYISTPPLQLCGWCSTASTAAAYRPFRSRTQARLDRKDLRVCRQPHPQLLRRHRVRIGTGAAVLQGPFGVDRSMHGTGHPFWPMPLGPRLLDQLELSAEDRDKVAHENAARVFRIQVLGRGGN